MNLYTYTNEFIQKELEMFFSDKENDFTHALYTITQATEGKAEYSLTLKPEYMNFKDQLSPANVFEYVTQIVDDVKEVILYDGQIDYKWWNDVVFSRDTTFDTAYFDSPKPTIIFKSNDKVGSLGKVLLCLSGDKISLRDLKGRVYTTIKADINSFNNGRYSYRSLSLSAMPKAYFTEDTRLRDEDKKLWGAHEDNVESISDLDTRLDDAVHYLQEEHEQNVADIDALERQFETGGDVYVLKSDYQTLNTKVNGIDSKVNEMYPRTVGDDSLLSETYKKATRNQVDIADLKEALNLNTSADTTLSERVTANEENIAENTKNIAKNREDIDSLLAYPETNIAVLPPFIVWKRGDYTVAHRRYDPIFWEDLESLGAPEGVAGGQNMWHLGEHRVKNMMKQILKDEYLGTIAEQLCKLADDGTLGGKVELATITNVFHFTQIAPNEFTGSVDYWDKTAVCIVSLVPVKYNAEKFKPGLLFEIVSGPLDGGTTLGSISGKFALVDKSETDTPEYHFYRYGDNCNINGITADCYIDAHR